jgi:uncharacterized integral membrane protein
VVIIALVLALLFAVVAAIFAIQNPTPVDVKFLTWDVVDGSLAVILILSYGIGVITGVLLLLPGLLRRSVQLAVQKKKIDDLARTAASSDDQAF